MPFEKLGHGPKDLDAVVELDEAVALAGNGT